MTKNINPLYLTEDSKKIKSVLKNGAIKTAHGIGYVSQTTGSFLKKNSKKISKAIEKTTDFALDKTGKGLEYAGKKMKSV